MTSVFRAPSQVAPLKRYVAQGTASSDAIARLYNEMGVASVTGSAHGVVYIDMGKTVVLANGAILRKVQREVPVGGDSTTAYMYLVKAPADQYFAALN